MKTNNENPKYPIYDNGQLHISISKGNGKLGNIPQFNTLPGDEPLRNSKGQLMTNITGTCKGRCAACKSACYAIKSALFHHNSVIAAWGKNTVIMRNDPDKVRTEINEYCKKNIVRYFRLHTSGEIESVNQFKLYCNICSDNPDIVFYIYTKAFDTIIDYMETYDRTLPENLVINMSVWHDNLQTCQHEMSELDREVFKSLLDQSNLFVYDDHTDAVGAFANLPHCPAIDKSGHETGITCAQCRRCMKRGNKTAVYAH